MNTMRGLFGLVMFVYLLQRISRRREPCPRSVV